MHCRLSNEHMLFIECTGLSMLQVGVQPVQVFRIGQLFIAGIPGEFTTQSGRRYVLHIVHAKLQ